LGEKEKVRIFKDRDRREINFGYEIGPPDKQDA
jgi:hypothetical protein